MIEDQISFWIFITFFGVLSILKTVNKFLADSREKSSQSEPSENWHQVYTISEHFEKTSRINEYNVESKNKPEIHFKKKQKKHLIKSIINYSISFNSSFLVAGSLSETYLHGVRIAGNIISIFVGQMYSYFIIHPFMYSLRDQIESPYDYLEKRYNKRYIKSLSSMLGMLFYFIFLSLYLWGCTAMIQIIYPDLSLSLINAIIGIYSIIGTLFGGLIQSTKINVFQFFILCIGLLTAMQITLFKNRNVSLMQLWSLAEMNQRTTFFDTNTDLYTHYTILNQALSLPMAWCSKLGLFFVDFSRYKSIESKKKSKILFLSNIPVMVFLNLILIIAGGFVCFLYFFGCDPLMRKQIKNKNQIGVYWLHLVLSRNLPSFSGILFASIIYYSIIQHSLGMNSCTKSIINETLGPYIIDRFKIKEKFKTLIKKFFLVCMGIMSLLISQAFQYGKKTMLSYFFMFNNLINSPLLGLFLLSMFIPYANHVGAAVAFVLNLLINFWFGSSLMFNQTKPQEFVRNTVLCAKSSNRFLYNISRLQSLNTKFLLENQDSEEQLNFNSNDKFLHSIYSITPIWYGLFSVIFIVFFGTLFSLIYSLISTGSLDADTKYKEERRKLLFYYRYKHFF